jgi:hypothetical protein
MKVWRCFARFGWSFASLRMTGGEKGIVGGEWGLSGLGVEFAWSSTSLR